MSREQLRAAGWGLFWSGLLATAIFVGSRNLWHVDAALVGYTFACLFAAFAVAYRYSMWLQRPPTRLYWRRGWQAFLKPGFFWANVRHLAGRFVPYHWPGAKSVNLAMISSQDPISKIPEYKVCAARIRKAERPEYAGRLEPQQ